MLRKVVGIVWLLFLAVFILDAVLVNNEFSALLTKWGQLKFLFVWGMISFGWMALTPSSRPAVVER